MREGIEDAKRGVPPLAGAGDAVTTAADPWVSSHLVPTLRLLHECECVVLCSSIEVCDAPVTEGGTSLVGSSDVGFSLLSCHSEADALRLPTSHVSPYLLRELSLVLRGQLDHALRSPLPGQRTA